MKLTSYADAEAFLNGFVNYEKLLGGPVRYDTTGFDLAGFRERLRRLGDPHLDYAVIHVAGTKGKGSTCAFLESALRAAGIRTGLYTSPHISRYTERIVAGGKPIPDARFCRLLERLTREFGRTNVGPPDAHSAPSDATFRTVFELLTAAAFLHFSEERVQVAIIETGLGGRLDSTNVFDEPGAGPLVTVITPIAFDHMGVLGNTIEQIAGEKAGILRPHGLTVLAPQPPEWGAQVREVVERRLQEIGGKDAWDAGKLLKWKAVESGELGSDCFPPAARFAVEEEGWERLMQAGTSFLATEMMLESPFLLSPALPGAHQLDNLRTVLCALAALDQAGTTSSSRELAEGVMQGCISSHYEITLEAVRRGVATARWPGRFEILSQDPLVIVDGAHCPLSVQAMAETYTSLFGPDREVILVAGFLRDKAAEGICAALRGRLKVAEVITCTPPTPRARPAAESARAFEAAIGGRVTAVEEPKEALKAALARRRGDQAVLVFGSMYLIGLAQEVGVGWT